MKGIVLLNGEPYLGEIDQTNSYVICADGGYNWSKGRVKMDETVGDFDSAFGEVSPAPRKIYPSEKDQTDGEIAIERMLELQAQGKIDCVEIYGGGGGREDHFLGNLHLLYRCAAAGLPNVLYTNGSELRACSSGLVLTGVQGKTISLLPLGGDAEILQTDGLKYSADGITLAYGCCRGISNVATKDEVRICVKTGIVLCVVNR